MRCGCVLWSTPEAPCEEVEACDYLHAGCADTESQLYSLIRGIYLLSYSPP